MQLLHKNPLAKMSIPFDFSAVLAAFGSPVATYSTQVDAGMFIDEVIVTDDVVTTIVRGGAEGSFYNVTVIASGAFGNQSITRTVLCETL